MKLCEEVKEVLDVSVPVWMKRLCAVDFDITKLEKHHQEIIDYDGSFCFIGELHNARAYRTDDGDHCTKCHALSLVIPYVFNTNAEEYNSISNERRCVALGRVFKNTKADRKALLKYISKHVQVEHKLLLNKKKLENKC